MKATGALRDSTDLRAVLESWGIRTKHTDQPVLFWLFEGENFMPTRSIIVAIAFLNGKKTLKEITEEAGN